MLIRPASKVVIKFLQLMQKHGYIGEFEFVDDHRAGKIVVELNGRLNKCGVISPRYDIGHSEVRKGCASQQGAWLAQGFAGSGRGSVWRAAVGVLVWLLQQVVQAAAAGLCTARRERDMRVSIRRLVA